MATLLQQKRLPLQANEDYDGDGYTESEGDCDDTEDSANPGMAEIPDNGKDNDCDPETPDVESHFFYCFWLAVFLSYRYTYTIYRIIISHRNTPSFDGYAFHKLSLFLQGGECMNFHTLLSQSSNLISCVPLQ